jgi:type I restriction enzyme S subunit
VVIGRYGTLGEVHYVLGHFWPLNTTLWVKDFKGNDPRFCAYLLRTIGVADTSGASAVPGVNRNVLHGLPVRCPPREIQARIASILGAYDDLIDINRRRGEVVEEMARRLFEEWFVRFRFPGHEGVPIVETPDGPIPEGWSMGVASDLVEFDPRTKVPRDGEKPFISMAHLDTSSALVAPPEWREGNSGAKFQNGDTLFARITPCLENGKTGLVQDLPEPGGVGFGSTEFIVMRGRKAGAAFTYCLARLPAFREHARSSMSGASGRQRARTESVALFELARPPADLTARFEAVAWPMLELAGRLGRTNEHLATSRDLLLPRLISGQLSVEAAERELEEAA